MKAGMLALVAVLGGCDGSDPVAGNGSETTTGSLARVVDSTGLPVAGALVEARPTAWIPLGENPRDPVISVQTDAQGWADLSALPSGAWTLVVSQGATRASLPWRLGEGLRTERVRLQLGRTGQVHGRIQDWDSGAGWVGIEGLPDRVRIDPTGEFFFDSLPGGALRIRVAMKDGRRSRTELRIHPSVVVEAGSLRAQRAEEHRSRADSLTVALTLDPSLVDTLLGYPLLVRLSDTVLDFGTTNGEDLLFTRHGKVLSHQVEWWDPQAKQAAVWVRLDTVLPGQSTFEFSMAYGGGGVPDWSDPAAVFRVAEGWRGVWHLDASDPGEDATGVHPLDDWRTRPVEGAVGRGRFCQTGWLRGSDSTDLHLQTMTLSAWVKRQGSQIPIGKFLSKGNRMPAENTWSLQFFDETLTPAFLSVREIRGGDTLRGQGHPMPDYQWSLVEATWDASNGRSILYLDGLPVDSAIVRDSIDYRSINPGDMDLFVGANLIGAIDEVRIAASARSADWIRLDHATQSGAPGPIRFHR